MGSVSPSVLKLQRQDGDENGACVVAFMVNSVSILHQFHHSCPRDIICPKLGIRASGTVQKPRFISIIQRLFSKKSTTGESAIE
jgi:hypothetical protein